jgi:hypothetical protein
VCSEAYPDPPPYDKCASDIIDRALKGSKTFAKLTKLPDGSPQDLEIKRLENAPDPACANSTRGDCFFWTIATNDNPFGLKAGTYPSASDGLWVDLKDGLQEGDYKLEFGGDFPSVRFKQQITYNLTVKAQ